MNGIRVVGKDWGPLCDAKSVPTAHIAPTRGFYAKRHAAPLHPRLSSS